MHDDITAHARLGLVHHMLHQGCAEDDVLHTETLLALLERKDIETLDCFAPFDPVRRALVAEAARQSGKTITATTHLSFMQSLNVSSPRNGDVGLARIACADQIDAAAAMGATGFVFVSGRGSEDREASRLAFATFCRWFCAQLDRHGITALLEPFDTDIDKAFLYGPTEDCMELIGSLEPEIGNMAINLDLAHLPLMRETSEHAVSTTASRLGRVHLGNCVLADTSNPWYGDKHPPMGLPGGEIGLAELTDFLRELLKVGYLGNGHKGDLVLEMQPFPDTSAEETIERSMDLLHEAWRQV
jgi:sugar phosphate isomerase/epimerase